MATRRSFLRSSFFFAAYVAATGRPASAANAPGVTETEIKFGQTMPYSGPASAFGVIGRTEAAFFKMVNEMGGVNGRKLNLISLDDGYSPPKTLEQTRRLVEQEQVAFMFQSVGTPTNLAVRPYLNDNKVPQLFSAVAADAIADPRYPWSIGLNPAISSEAHIYAKHILATRPDAKIGILFQNDSFGQTFATGIREGVGPEHAAMIVKEISYEVSAPTVDSQIVSLQGAGADTFIIAAAPKAAAQAIRKAFDIGWTPDRYLYNGSSSITGTLKSAGLDKAKGVVTAGYGKDPNDPRWKDDPGYLGWADFANKYLGRNQTGDAVAVYGYGAAMLLVQVLRQCGDDLSRENIMRQALNLKDLDEPMGLPGARLNTSPTNYFPLRQLQLERFNGENWEPFGDVMSD